MTTFQDKFQPTQPLTWAQANMTWEEADFAWQDDVATPYADTNASSPVGYSDKLTSPGTSYTDKY